ncbi:hypothetical protein EW093_10150 [Thiospirochaeta perfilievii]|uniref:MnmC-like methyltransferase domain-containing protein n=1 Tax=Thiospirochaeta perfilievii TaxID=252967 RepID=A0A5C1QEA9_9SPIO|nr:tRNA (5-methylaminomethyl-2-thiouridine)(34)-methyltransferase MnmD [Thiospirochaeta perfilievii]QEN05054.1 hypothetical protein EW093_10150 [Thiospirochaeta perfilievii]
MEEKLINEYFDDCYFSDESGYLESEYVFINGNNLESRLNEELSIGETGFGTGLNLLVLEEFLEGKLVADKTVKFTTVEKYIIEVDVVKKALSSLANISEESLSRHLNLYEEICANKKNGWNSISVDRSWGRLEFNLFYGDIMDCFENYPIKNNCWFFDGHSPDKNPEMWSVELFKNVSKQTKKGGTFATFTAAGVVKRALRDAGFTVKRKKGFGRKRHMITGFF